jgi:RND family efflux transporter MFP subunit
MQAMRIFFLAPMAMSAALLAAPAAAQDFVGLIHARHNLTLSVGVGGVVSRVLVQPGRKVGAGQPLLQLDENMQATEAERRKIVLDDLSELKATELRVKLMEPMLADTRKMAATRGSISRDEATRMELDFAAAQGRLQQLQAQKKREKLELQLSELDRGQRRLLAPVAGVITKVSVEAGEWAKPGEPVIQLVDASVVELRVNVPYTALKGLAVGTVMPVSFEPDTNVAIVQGTVNYVAPVVDAASGLSEIRLTIQNPKLLVPAGIKAIISLNGKGKAK